LIGATQGARGTSRPDVDEPDVDEPDVDVDLGRRLDDDEFDDDEPLH